MSIEGVRIQIDFDLKRILVFGHYSAKDIDTLNYEFLRYFRDEIWRDYRIWYTELTDVTVDLNDYWE